MNPMDYYTMILGGYYKDTENIGNASYAFWEEQNKKLDAY